MLFLNVMRVVPWLGGGVRTFDDPEMVEFIQADVGIDIGDTFIGMHTKHAAVPVRLCVKEIGAIL